jgi:hypothetical protein
LTWVSVLTKQPRVHELIGKQLVVRVGEYRARAHRAGGGVDLIVDGEQVPAAIWCCLERSSASTCIARPVAICAVTSSISSSAMVKITVIGCSCVMTHRPVVPLAGTILPGSILRSPTRPSIGETIRV